MLTVEKALALVEKNSAALGARSVSIGDADGLVLAEEIRSEINSPPYDKALMDGYAVRSTDRQAERRILEEVAAGDVPRLALTAGTATRIMTGAPLPDGADAIVQIERTALVNESTVRLEQVDAIAGQSVLPLGASLRAGDVVLRAGTEIRPIEIGVLAELGRGEVTAISRPRVAILPTGNELVSVNETPGPGQIRNSNGPLLTAAVARAGGVPIELEVARDDRDMLRLLVEQGLHADVLVLSGGVSAGKFDLVPDVLAELGVEEVFHKISLRPGKPLWFGVKRESGRRVLVFGLPGNPVSSLVCFELFVRPAIAALAGRGFVGLRNVRAPLAHKFDHKGERAAYLPSSLSRNAAGDSTVTILPWQGSADLATLARANCLVRLPVEPVRLEVGAMVEAVLI